MKKQNNFKQLAFSLLAAVLVMSSCKKDDEVTASPDNSPATYSQEDQMGRPAINTVFVTSSDKDNFNMTIPSEMGAEYQPKFETQLLALNAGYTTNALTLDAAAFTGVLASDILTVAMSGKTTFFDGRIALTGRALDDDVITTELTLIFGGPMGTDNPGLTNDNVISNDKVFSNVFPYLASAH